MGDFRAENFKQETRKTGRLLEVGKAGTKEVH
jgi:hypothetical protein